MTSTTSMERPTYHGLDHLRALAIVMVFFFHYGIVTHGEPEWLPPLAQFGWTGVDLFFVLSGFLIASSLFEQIQHEKRIALKSFFVKRVFRILPAYWVTVALYFCFTSFHEKEALPPLWRFLTFTQNFNLNIKDFGTFSHAWSLCVEEHFYLLFPLVLFVFQKTKKLNKAYLLIVILILSGLLLRAYIYFQCYLPKVNEEDSWRYWYAYIYYPTFTRLDGLLVGISIAATVVFLPKYWQKITQLGNVVLLVGMTILGIAFYLCMEQDTASASVLGYPIIALGYGCLVIAALSPCCFLYRWNSAFTAFIASISYSLYLIHKGVIHVTHICLAEYNFNSNSMLLISILSCLIAALLLNRLIEKPFMRWRTIFVAE
jgi:peptidoglycan/LPS O-acetylase OafA/YrhL